MNSESRFHCFQGLLFRLADYIAIYVTLKYLFLNLEVTNEITRTMVRNQIWKGCFTA